MKTIILHLLRVCVICGVLTKGYLMTSPVKILRRALEMTQKEFAQFIGVSRTMVGNYEFKRKFPSHKMIMKLIKIAKDNNISINTEDFFKNDNYS